MDKINIETELGRGELALHITNYNNLHSEAFKEGFKTREIIQYALDELPSAWLMIPDYSNQAKSILNRMLDNDELGGCVSGVSDKPTQVDSLHTKTPQNAPVFAVPVVLMTNKGEFKSIEVMMGNLSKMYPHIDNIDVIVSMSKGDMGLDGSTAFLDEPSFTSLIKIIKIKCDNDMVSQLGGISPIAVSHYVGDKRIDNLVGDINDPVKVYGKDDSDCSLIDNKGFKVGEDWKVDELVGLDLSSGDKSVDLSGKDGTIPDKIDYGIADVSTHPYQLVTNDSVEYFETWEDALGAQKGYNKDNGAKIRATKR